MGIDFGLALGKVDLSQTEIQASPSFPLQLFVVLYHFSCKYERSGFFWCKMLHGVQRRLSDCPSQTAATSPTTFPERPHLIQQEIS